MPYLTSILSYWIKILLTWPTWMFMRTGRHHFIHAYDGQVDRFVLKFRNPNLFHCPTRWTLKYNPEQLRLRKVAVTIKVFFYWEGDRGATMWKARSKQFLTQLTQPDRKLGVSTGPGVCWACIVALLALGHPLTCFSVHGLHRLTVSPDGQLTHFESICFQTNRNSQVLSLVTQTPILSAV